MCEQGGVESTTLNNFLSRGAMMMKFGRNHLYHKQKLLKEKKVDEIKYLMTS